MREVIISETPAVQRIALISMPFLAADRPSIQIGLLASIARQNGFQCDTFHLNLELAAQIPTIYESLCNIRPHMTGEWLFSYAAFCDCDLKDETEYYRDFPDVLNWMERKNLDASVIRRLRHEQLPRFIGTCADMVDWGDYQVVGFSSTFQQNVASLALARAIKSRWPKTVVVFGGANMEGVMGVAYAKAFPFIDHVVTGEGDITFPQLVKALASRGDIRQIDGITWCDDELSVHSTAPAKPFADLDALPVPDYTEYFERYERLGLRPRNGTFHAVTFESSRGCWWGERHHCTFCGLNGQTMRYRVKKPERVKAELKELSRRHGITLFLASDNIMDLRYVKEFFATLEEEKLDFTFWYETKSNLTYEQLRTLRRGGVIYLQPGIESLNSRVLQLMDKGCTMLQNLQTIKWGGYLGMRVLWNLLWGFPGETEKDYAEEYEVLQSLSHFQPPLSVGRIWMERFAPIFSDRQRFPGVIVQPEGSYHHIYPKHLNLNDAAYFFEYELDNTLPNDVHVPTQRWVSKWRSQWLSSSVPTLTYRTIPDMIIIDDKRGDQHGLTMLEEPAASIYTACAISSQSTQNIVELVRKRGHNVSDDRVADIVDGLCDKRLMVTEKGRYLSLAFPANQGWR